MLRKIFLAVATCATAAAFLCLALPALAERPDVMIPVKGSVGVSVESPGDVVTLGVLLTDASSTKVSLSVKAAKKSPLELDVRLVAPDGTAFDPSSSGKVAAKTAKYAAKFVGVPQAGLWRIEIRGANDSVGDCTVKLVAVEKQNVKDSKIVPVNFSADVPFSVGEDQELTVKLKRGKGSQIVPVLELIDPSGLSVPVSDLVKTSTKAGTAQLKKFRLPVFGEYVLRLRGNAGVGGTVAYAISTKLAKLTTDLPVADAGDSFEGEPGTSVRLNGSVTPSNGSSLFRWAQVAGDPVVLSDPLSPTPSFPAPTKAQSLVFQLSAETSGRLSHAVPVVVSIGRRPVADAGASRTVAPNSSVTLDGQASFNRTTRPLRFAWQQLASDAVQVALDDAHSATPSFTTPNTDATLHFDLVVDDGEVRSFPDRVIVAVGGDTVADAGRDQYVSRMATVHLSGLRSVRPGAALAGGLEWTQVGGPLIALDGADGPYPSFTAPKFSTDLEFELTVDGDASTKDRVAVHVRSSETNSPAQVSTTRPTPVTIGAVTLAATATDPNGNALRYTWGQLEGEAAAVADATAKNAAVTLPAGPGAYVFAVMANDGLMYGAPDTCWATNTGYSGAPIADAGNDRVSAPDTAILLDARRSVRTDGGTDPLTFHWEQVSGTDWFDVATKDPTFVASGATTSFKLPASISSLTPTRTITFALTAGDGTSTSEPDLVTITLGGIPLNGLPVVTAQASTLNPISGATVQLTGTVEELDGDPLTYLWTRVSGPSVTFFPNAGVLSPTIVAPTSGTVVLRFTASDPFDTSAPAQLTLTVNARPTAVVSVSPTVGDVGTLVTVDGRNSSDPEGADVSYLWSQTAGATVTFDPNAAFFTFTPAVTGQVSFQLVVNDGRQPSLPATGTFSTSPPPSTNPTASLVRAPYGATVSLQANPPAGSNFTYTWRQINSGSDPSITLSSTSSENPTFAAPVPTSSPFDGADFNGANESLPSATFGVVASNGQTQSAEKTVTVKFFATLSSTSTAIANRVEEIVKITCSSCHSGNGSSGSCGFGSNAAFFGLQSKTGILNGVNANCVCSSGVRLSPGNPNSSVFWTRINGQGGTMPPAGNGSLSTLEKNIIKDWISQGCKDN